MDKKNIELLSTPQIADACLQLNLPFNIAPSGIKSVLPHQKLHGRVLPVRHYGSVDVFLEVMQNAQEGDVLVIDNNGRLDEGCIGDLTVLEAEAHKIKGIIVWGAHRDTTEIKEIQFPVFSYGAFPSGPRRLDNREDNALQSARFDNFLVTNNDYVIADEDGVIFIPLKNLNEIRKAAIQIWEKERIQVEKILKGETLIDQLQFNEYLLKNKNDSSYTFRKHLNIIGGAIEK